MPSATPLPAAVPAIPTINIVGTNTLIVTNIPRLYFASPPVLSEIASQFSQHGYIDRFIPIKSFTRILIIYEEASCAMAAKIALDRMVIPQEVYRFVRQAARDELELQLQDENDEVFQNQDATLRVYFGENTPLHQCTEYLLPPELEKNWLISPPGSPPVGWEQVREVGPNKAVLPEDLFHALVGIQKGGQDWEDDELEDPGESSSSSSSLLVPTTTFLITHDPNSPNQPSSDLPQIMVQDFDSPDSSDTDESGRATRNQRKGKRTRRGPRIQNTPHPRLLGRASTPIPI